jgi:hypothetical protein
MRLDSPRGTWDFRRQMAVRILQFCAGIVIAALVLPWVNADVAGKVVMSAFTLAGVIASAYLGAATTHDVLSRPAPSAITPSPPKPPPAPAKDAVID